MWRIGLTGGIGSGKSTVARLLQGNGAELIDTDAIARELTQAGGVAMPALLGAFGQDLVEPSGALDRLKMRQLAFSDANIRRTLEGILHPLIREQAAKRASTSAAKRWRDQVDLVWVVDCSRETQIERVLQRPGWTASHVNDVIAQQASRAQRRACADVVLFNDGLSLEQLAQLVDGTSKCLQTA